MKVPCFFQEKGYSPEALLNFLAVAGGGFGKQEGCDIYDLDTLSSKVSLNQISKNEYSCFFYMLTHFL